VRSRSIFFLCLDSCGDLTLRQPTFRSLLDSGNRIGVAVRTPHDRLLPFLDRRLEAIVTDLRPSETPDATFWARAAALQERVAAFAPDLVVCAPYDRTFLDQWLLRGCDASTLGFANTEVSDADLDGQAPGAPRHAASALSRSVSVSQDAPEVDRNRALLEAITGATVRDYEPRIQIQERDEARARRFLEEVGLEAGRYAFAAPAGTVDQALKAWRRDAILDVVERLERRHGLPTLVTGELASESEALDGLVEASAERGLRLGRWVGGPDDLGALLGLIRLSRLYVGSETGPMHFAAAMDVPVLALLGGGRWPRFLPSARRSFVATRQLPCFGCGWECWLPEPACLTTVDTRVLLEGLDWLLSEDAPGRRVDSGTPLDEQAQGMVREGAVLHRGARARIVALERERRRLEESLQGSEIEKTRQLRTIAHREELIGRLSEQVAHLSTAPAALRVLSAAALRKAGLFDLARRGRERIKAGGGGLEPGEPTAPGSRPLPDALAVARSLPGPTPDPVLERLYQLGATLPHVICIHPTPRNLQAAVMLASGGARVSWLGEASALQALDTPGLEAPAPDLGSWLIASTRSTLPHGAALLLDADGDEESLRLLAWRVAPNTVLLVNGAAARGGWTAALLPPATERVASLSVHRSPPAAWQDPAGGDGDFTLPDRLPSGRPWPRITVVTATLNQARFLEQTLLSVLRQDYPDLEYIVRDGGSTDGTRDILERYRGRLAHCVIESDEGQADALNKGFALATGQILAWLNSDDRYPAGSLWRAAVAFDSYPADLVVGGCRLVRGARDETVRVHHPALTPGCLVPLPLDRILDLEGSWLKGDFFFQPEVFWTREIWERSGGGLAKDLHYGMDYELWARMAHEGARAVHVPDILAVYRMHEDQKTAGLHLPYLPELRRVSESLRRRWSIP
jgi:ADP-heptose:LPS heptosyltransferase/GT2 family glycosyltransferase